MRSGVERRRFRRAELEGIPVVIRSLEKPGNAAPVTGEVKNASLAGVYCQVSAPCSLHPGDSVLSSIDIPSEHARAFPFARLAGKGLVVRVEPLPVGKRAGEVSADEPLLGLAVAFSSDATALGTIESQ